MLLTDDQVDRISPDGLIHDAQRLRELQALDLSRKIGITIARIIEFYNYFNGNVYISFSGGKDSTVLLHIARQLFPDIPAVFSNTGLEYPELQKFVKSFDNVVTVYPSMRFPDVIGIYGYPLISKEVSEAIYYARRISPPPPTENAGTSKTQTRNAWPPRRYKEGYAKRREFMGLRRNGERRTEQNRTEQNRTEQKGAARPWRPGDGDAFWGRTARKIKLAQTMPHRGSWAC